MAVLAAKLAALSYCWRLLPGLQLLEVIVAGKNQNGLIRNMHLLPSSELEHRTSKLNCCSVHEGRAPAFLTFSFSCPNIIV